MTNTNDIFGLALTLFQKLLEELHNLVENPKKLEQKKLNTSCPV